MGSVVISIDAELGWGFHDMPAASPHRVEAGRRGWTQLISLFEEYDIPATWAVVGHLFLSECDGIHEDHPLSPDWFRREQTDWQHREDLRFGPDLVQDIIASPVDHEIGSHSFSHILFGSPDTDHEVARYEVKRSREIAADWGLELESFVFPRNDVGHRSLLADAGFSTYRGTSPTRDGVRGMMDAAIRGDSPLVTPTVDEYGLVDIPASTFLFGFEGPSRTLVESVWRDPMLVQVARGIEAAIEQPGIYHVWLHPNNLVDDRDDRRMRAVLEEIDRARCEHGLRVETMGSVANRLRREGCVEPGCPARGAVNGTVSLPDGSLKESGR